VIDDKDLVRSRQSLREGEAYLTAADDYDTHKRVILLHGRLVLVLLV
jgi:hypothetical protein